MPQNSQSLEKVLSLAAEKAGVMGTATINVPCLVVAIAAEGTSLAASLLKNEGLTPDVLERTARNLYGSWQPNQAAAVAQPSMSKDAQNILQSAGSLALESGHVCLTPTHVLHFAVTHHEGEKL
ncbi:MAG TPA: Clp protease N-terminal domain-containing protein, partial [Candidatus Obscuribacterales bacterium]